MLNILRRFWPHRKPEARVTAKSLPSFVDVVNETHQAMSEAAEAIPAAVESRRHQRRLCDQPLLNAPAHPYVLLTPIPLAERKPGNGDYCGDFVWWGSWDVDRWLWDLQEHPDLQHTHWLPATVEALPARCCPPEVEHVGFAAVKQRIEAAHVKPAHAPLTASMLDELVRRMDASQPEVW